MKNQNDRYIFRGKRTDNGQWIEGSLHSRRRHTDSPNELGISWDDGHNGFWVEVDPETVGQLLRTENKEKLECRYFEGDIVLHPSYGYLKVTFDNEALEVVFEWPNGKSTYPVRMIKEYILDVVGNIFDNPELLTP